MTRNLLRLAIIELFLAAACSEPQGAAVAAPSATAGEHASNDGRCDELRAREEKLIRAAKGCKRGSPGCVEAAGGHHLDETACGTVSLEADDARQVDAVDLEMTRMSCGTVARASCPPRGP